MDLYIKKDNDFLRIYPVKELSEKYPEFNENYFTQAIKYRKIENFKISNKMYVLESEYKKLIEYAELTKRKKAL